MSDDFTTHRELTMRTALASIIYSAVAVVLAVAIGVALAMIVGAH